jgi:hypothetical protein
VDPLGGERERERERGAGAQEWELGRKAEGEGSWVVFHFLFILNHVFLLFLISPLDSNSNMPQSQIRAPQAYASNKNKVWGPA